MTRTVILIGLFFYILCFTSVAWAGETLTVKVRATVTPYCNTGSEYVKCEDIPVFPLTEEDYSEPPTPEEQWAALEVWRAGDAVQKRD